MSRLSDSVIDRPSPVPFCFQLAEVLEQEIVSGRSQNGTRLPYEPDMSHGPGTYLTVRQASQRLNQRGPVECRKGYGAFVFRLTARLWLM
jgi:DNA-binding FadR family transcriptional regulator